MNVFYKRSLLFLGGLFLFLGDQQTVAQTVFVGNDDIVRQLQLQNKIDLGSSLCARPFFTDKQLSSDSLYQLVEPGIGYGLYRNIRIGKNKQFSLLPITLATQFNSHHPYGWGQPDMIQAKGLQSVMGAGLYASAGIFSLQIAPEFAYADNPNFEHNTYYGANSPGTYHHLFAGQSSFRINVGAVSLGLSTENMWWGPGINNSLLMSSNAPGFLHLTFNSRKPLKTAIGSFEWQFISGKLYEDTTVLLENKNLTSTYYNPYDYSGDGYSGLYDLKEKWRYINAITITYQPKWVKGLFLGVNRVGYAYNDGLKNGDPSFFQSYLPTIFGVFRQSYAYGLNLPGGSKRYKQMASLHMRYVFPKAHAEFYGEYGWGDNQYNIRDFVLNIDHSRAYIFGIRKMMPLANKSWLDWQFEMTQLSQTPSYIVRTADNWYRYQGGYTNQSRIIGAGIGMGNDVQTMTLSWVDGFTRIGIKLERLQHDPNNYPVFWTDESVGFLGQKRYGRLLISGEVQLVQSGNYLWIDNNNRFNFRGMCKISYSF